MQMFEGNLQAQREGIRQQGQQDQAALADPKQAQLQRDAQQRTLELQKTWRLWSSRPWRIWRRKGCWMRVKRLVIAIAWICST